MQEPTSEPDPMAVGLSAISNHALQRMRERRISEGAVRATLEHGRTVHVRGVAIYVIGRKEVSRLRRRDIDVADYEGVQVVCACDGTILTAYRNRDFRSLRPRHRGRHGVHLGSGRKSLWQA